MPFTNAQIKIIAELLNRRGFVIAADIPGPTGERFPAAIMREMHKIIQAGYKGTNVHSWNTGFRRTEYDYGVTRSYQDPPNIVIDKYVTITQIHYDTAEFRNHLDRDNIRVEDFRSWCLGVVFLCPHCEREGRSDLKSPQIGFNKRIVDVTGHCQHCGHGGIQVHGFYRNF